MTGELSVQNKRKKVVSYLKVWFWKNKEPTEDQFNHFIGLLMAETGYSERQLINVCESLCKTKFLQRTSENDNLHLYKCIYVPNNETLEKAVGTEDYKEINDRFRPSTIFK